MLNMRMNKKTMLKNFRILETTCKKQNEDIKDLKKACKQSNNQELKKAAIEKIQNNNWRFAYITANEDTTKENIIRKYEDLYNDMVQGMNLEDELIKVLQSYKWEV
ncbi:MAG: hypothetical protein PVJ67_05115 [Candidatus Pacearchaeota archaeon]|jgi:hypothetical protein